MKAIHEDLYKTVLAAILEKPRYWSNGKAVYEFMKYKYREETTKIVEEYGCSCEEDDTQIKQFIEYIKEELNKKNLK